MTEPLLLHIGYQKTGSTWLQRFLFPNAKLDFAMPFSIQEFDRNLTSPNPLHFDPAAARGFFRGELLETARQGLLPVISRERLSGSTFAGGFDSKEQADRLAAVFPDAKVLIVIRRQPDLLLSLYNQHVRGGGLWTLPHYLQPPLTDVRRLRLPGFKLSRYGYHHLIGYYMARFGQDSVLVLPYELFQQEPVTFVNRICTFVGLTEQHNQVSSLPFHTHLNPSLSGNVLALKRVLNRVICERSYWNPAPLFPSNNGHYWVLRQLYRIDRWIPATVKEKKRREMQKVVAEIVGNRYAESNARTAQLTGLDLAKYGYALPANDPPGAETFSG